MMVRPLGITAVVPVIHQYRSAIGSSCINDRLADPQSEAVHEQRIGEAETPIRMPSKRLGGHHAIAATRCDGAQGKPGSG
jgi:hypothetical protein